MELRAKEHGTRYRYNCGCRCESCRTAAVESNRKWREKNKVLTAAGKIPNSVLHGKVSTYANWGCRCRPCKTAFHAAGREASAKWYKKWRDEHPEEARRISNRRSRQLRGRSQAETSAKASRSYQQWTGPELELASRADLSARQVALMIGRTYSAVRNMREKLRVDPRKQNVAGISKGVGRKP